MRLAAISSIAALLFCAAAQAQEYPAKPVRIVVPWAAGGRPIRSAGCSPASSPKPRPAVRHRQSPGCDRHHRPCAGGEITRRWLRPTSRLEQHVLDRAALVQESVLRRRSGVRADCAGRDHSADPVAASIGAGERRAIVRRACQGASGRDRVFECRRWRHQSSRYGVVHDDDCDAHGACALQGWGTVGHGIARRRDDDVVRRRGDLPAVLRKPASCARSAPAGCIVRRSCRKCRRCPSPG